MLFLVSHFCYTPCVVIGTSIWKVRASLIGTEWKNFVFWNMGVSSQLSLVSLSLKDLFQGTEEHKYSSYGYLWSKVLASQAKKEKVIKKSVKSRRPRRILMKRRVGSRRGANGIQRRVRTLKRLIPNSDNMGLDGLFRDTANYILSLQTRVRVMQVRVKVLTGSDEWLIQL